MDEQLSEKLYTVFNLGDIFRRGLFKYLDYKDLSRLHAVWPALVEEKVTAHMLMSRFASLNVTPECKLSLSVQNLTFEDFYHLLHWRDHTRWEKLLRSLKDPAMHHSRRPDRLFGLEVDMYDPFPLSEPTTKTAYLEACCFLGPSAPAPYSEALVLADSDDGVSVYIQTDCKFQLAFHTRLAVKIIEMQASPGGDKVACMAKSRTLKLLVFSEGVITTLDLGVNVELNRMLGNGLWHDNNVLLLPDFPRMKLWLYRVDDEGNLRKSLYDLRKVPNLYFMALYNLYPATRKRPEVFCYGTACEHVTHAHHRINFWCMGKMYNVTFPRSVICGWVLDREDNVTLYVAAITSGNLQTTQYQKLRIFLEPEKARCASYRWNDNLVFLVVYSVDLASLNDPKTYALPRWHHVMDKSNHSRHWNSWDIYTKVACPAAKHSVITLCDRMLAVKLGFGSLVLFPTVTSIDSVHFVHQFEGYRKKFCISQTGEYLFDFPDHLRCWKPLMARRACPLLNDGNFSKLPPSRTKHVVLEIERTIHGEARHVEVTKVQLVYFQDDLLFLVRPKGNSARQSD
jgi:hypothetical protein